MRWIVSVGTLVLVGLAVGRAGRTLSRTSLPQRSARAAFRGEEGDAANQGHCHGTRAAESGRRTYAVGGGRDRSVGPHPAPDETTAISDFTGSTERNAPAAIQATRRTAMPGRAAFEDTPRIGVSDLDEAEMAHQQKKGRFVPIRSSGPSQCFGLHGAARSNSDRPQSDCRRSRR